MNEEERKEYMREYRKKNKERIKEKRIEWLNKNPDKVQEYKERYKNKYGAGSEYRKEYREKNREILREKKRRYYERNKEKVMESNNRWRKDNIDKVQFANRKYYQRKRSSFHHYEESDWVYALNFFSHSCAYCGGKEKMEQEHIVPVSKGGPYIASNIIPACRSCNASKGDEDLEMWYRSHKSFNCERLEKVYEYIEGVQTIERSEGIPKSN